MDYIRLGNTSLYVSKLCFGGLTVGPLQANLSIEEGAKVIAHAFDNGVNFIDVAKLYNTYPYVKKALEITKNKNIIISSKSYDYTYEGMEESINQALNELNVKKISIFSLHEQESRLTLKGHRDALQYLIKAKKQGIIDAIGVSTHAIEVVNAVCDMDEIDIIHPIYNKKGLGIIDGSIDEMMIAIEKANKCGKGIYSMKPLGGGNLISNSEECFDFVLKNPNIHSIAVGMQSIEEVDINIEIFEGKEIDERINEKLKQRKKSLHIDEWCEGCGKCVRACKNDALKLENGKSVVDSEKCILCGYCSAACPGFYITVV